MNQIQVVQLCSTLDCSILSQSVIKSLWVKIIYVSTFVNNDKIHTYVTKDLFISMSVIFSYHHVSFSRKCLKDHTKNQPNFIKYVYLQQSSEDTNHLPKFPKSPQLFLFYQIEAPFLQAGRRHNKTKKQSCAARQ